jgi:hypothetical protein
MILYWRRLVASKIVPALAAQDDAARGDSQRIGDLVGTALKEDGSAKSRRIGRKRGYFIDRLLDARARIARCRRERARHGNIGQSHAAAVIAHVRKIGDVVAFGIGSVAQKAILSLLYPRADRHWRALARDASAVASTGCAPVRAVVCFAARPRRTTRSF